LPLALATTTLVCAGVGTALYAAAYGIPVNPVNFGETKLNEAYASIAFYGLAGVALSATIAAGFDWLDDRHRPLQLSVSTRRDGAGIVLSSTF
jgi:hypothetical protein